MAAIATIVFGIALLIQGGTMLSEYARLIFPSGVGASPIDQFGGSSLSAVFLVGAGGVVLGVLALLGVNSAVLTPVATIAFGTALVLSSTAIWNLYVLGRALAASTRAEGADRFDKVEFFASDLASGTAGIQSLAGLAAIVLGVLALLGAKEDLTLNLSALLALGSSLIVTGGSLSAMVLSLMRPWRRAFAQSASRIGTNQPKL